MKIHKHQIYLSTINPGLTFRVPGRPLSVGLDPRGAPSIWFDADADPAEVLPLFTGQDIDLPTFAGFLGSLTWSTLVWHFFYWASA